jgi:acyl-CoA reductase-like NAD-dependent aldehyde dehydrogenase
MVPMERSQAGEGKLAFTLRVPIGIVGAISPFNFPLNLVAHKLAPALARGCAVVLKPATQTPLSALLLAELEEEAGSRRLAERRRRPGLGDRRRARRGRARAADHVHRLGRRRLGLASARRARSVNLELGNATPVIVDADADLDDVPAKLAANAFSFAGQSCISVQRDLRRARRYDAFVERFVPKVEALKSATRPTTTRTSAR